MFEPSVDGVEVDGDKRTGESREVPEATLNCDVSNQKFDLYTNQQIACCLNIARLDPA